MVDGVFRKDEDFQFPRPFLDRLPSDFSHTQAILELLLTGAIYTGPRLAAAGLTESDLCPGCQVRETHQHLFAECPLYSQSRPVRGSEFLLTWATGIFCSPDEIPTSSQTCITFPEFSKKIQASSPVFADGSAFHDKWRTSAASVVVPGQFQFATLLPGSDHTSQRAELYALLLALKATRGPVRIACDCANVVDRACPLKSRGYLRSDISCFDNYDLWACFLGKRFGSAEVMISLCSKSQLTSVQAIWPKIPL